MKINKQTIKNLAIECANEAISEEYDWELPESPEKIELLPHEVDALANLLSVPSLDDQHEVLQIFKDSFFQQLVDVKKIIILNNLSTGLASDWESSCVLENVKPSEIKLTKEEKIEIQNILLFKFNNLFNSINSEKSLS